LSEESIKGTDFASPILAGVLARYGDKSKSELVDLLVNELAWVENEEEAEDIVEKIREGKESSD